MTKVKERREALQGEPRLLLSPDEAAELLGVGRTTVYQLLRSGELPYGKIGRRTVISRATLEGFVSRVARDGEKK